MNLLFLDNQTNLTFEKVGMPVRLSESPDVWQRDIAGEIYKQLPYLGDFAVNVILDRVDAQRGYGFGSAEVSNKTDAPTPNQQELPSIRIPIIIRDYLMAPLDIFLDGTGVYPLTEERLRAKLFRTDTFELSTRKPSDKGLVDQLYPPMRTNHGMGTIGADGMGMGKLAHLMDVIAPTISEQDVERFAQRIENDPYLKRAFWNNENFHKIAYQILNTPRITVEKTASAIVESIKPTVVQLEKLASGNFNVKWANANAYLPQQDTIGPGQASQMAGADISKMQPGQTITLTTEKAQKESLTEKPYIKVENFGKYKTIGADDNQEHIGYCIPIIDMEMHPLELFVFYKPSVGPSYSGSTNTIPVKSSGGEPGAWSVQDEIAGHPVPEDGEQFYIDLGEPKYVPRGPGVFVSYEGGCCLPPMTVTKLSGTPDGTIAIEAQDLWAQEIVMFMTPGIDAILPLGPGQYAIPEFLNWIPLEGDPTFLVKSPADIKNVEQAKQLPNQVQVGSTGPGEFHMEGQPLAKVASADKTFLKKAQAEFLLVAMGVDPFEAKDIMQRAERGEQVKVACNTITPLSSLHAEAVKQASIDLENFPYHLKQDLVKEAAVIDDAATADKVLSMNFINPENISMFAKYLPELDQASKKLAELLLASRLGMGTVDEGALERSMQAMEKVIEGLKQLQQNAIDYKS